MFERFRKNRDNKIALRTEKVKARSEVAKHRKWSFMSLAVIAVVILLMQYSGVISLTGIWDFIKPILTDFNNITVVN